MRHDRLGWYLWPIISAVLGNAPAVLGGGQLDGSAQFGEAQLSVRFTTAASKVAALSPLAVTLQVANVGAVPLTIPVAKDGAPTGWIAHLVGPGSEQMECSPLQVGVQRHAREMVLEPGQETNGSGLLLSAGQPGGYVFPQEGRYTLRVTYTGSSGSVSLAGELQIDVTEGAADTRALVSLLGPIGIDLFGLDRIRAERDPDFRVLGSVKLLMHVIACESGEIFDPQTERGSRYHRVHAQLDDLLVRYPETEYSGFLARYLGLHAMKAYERKHSTSTPLAHETASSDGALAHLELAANRATWPLHASLAALGDLHVLRRDWESVARTSGRLRAIGAPGGTEGATRLDTRASKYRAKTDTSRREGPADEP